MVPLLSLLASLLLLASQTGTHALGSYDPYMDAADLYRMQLLSNAFEYPGDKLDVEGLGGGVMDVPYGLMGGAEDDDRLVDFDDVSGAAYWPEELVAELAAAADAEDGGLRVGDQAVDEPSQALPQDKEEAEEAEEEEDVAEQVVKEAAKEEQDKEEEQEEEQEKQQVFKNAPKYSGAQLRDQEHLEHSALHGYQSVSGGTVNGESKESKTDKALPAYCNPPNPCPVGKTAAEDNCVENFENSAENNQRLLSQQECPCDTEHMFTCPEGSQTVSSKAQGSSAAGGAGTPEAGAEAAAEASQQMQLNKVIAELSNMEHEGQNLENNPTFSSTHKRMKVVAKKSPQFMSKQSELPYFKNPYLTGNKIKIAAKKSPELAKNAFPEWEMN